MVLPDPIRPGAPAAGSGQPWDALFDDLEQQWHGLRLEERAWAVADLGVAAYAEVSMAARVHASLGREVSVVCLGGHQVRGVLRRAGADFVVVGDWAVRVDAVSTIEGVAERALPEEKRGVSAALGFGSVLRAAGEATVVLVDGTRVVGRLGRVGADFVEVERNGSGAVLRTAAIAAVRGGR